MENPKPLWILKLIAGNRTELLCKNSYGVNFFRNKEVNFKNSLISLEEKQVSESQKPMGYQMQWE